VFAKLLKQQEPENQSDTRKENDEESLIEKWHRELLQRRKDEANA
jgi:hypothetical protein